MTAPVRWEPDVHMVDAVLASPKASRSMGELEPADRSWLVAGLTLAGVTAQEIADRLGCSLRLVRAIRAEPMTQMVVLWQEDVTAADVELRAERCEHGLTRRELADVCAERDRLRMQLDQVLGKLMTGALAAFPRCGHPKVKYNIYRCGVAEYCRTCRREWDAKRRKPKAA